MLEQRRDVGGKDGRDYHYRVLLTGTLLLFPTTTECILTDSLLPLLLDDGVLSTIQWDSVRSTLLCTLCGSSVVPLDSVVTEHHGHSR